MPKGQPVHLLSGVDPVARTATCSVCGPVAIKNKGLRNGLGKWSCYEAWKQNNAGRGSTRPGRRQYIRYRGWGCENPDCTAVILHPSQLDVHHIDGNHTNNAPHNLMTLCANCHRLWHHHGRAA